MDTSARKICKQCKRYLGMEEGWEEFCPSCRKENKKNKKKRLITANYTATNLFLFT